jgi:hypothetical protein
VIVLTTLSSLIVDRRPLLASVSHQQTPADQGEREGMAWRHVSHLAGTAPAVTFQLSAELARVGVVSSRVSQLVNEMASIHSWRGLNVERNPWSRDWSRGKRDDPIPALSTPNLMDPTTAVLSKFPVPVAAAQYPDLHLGFFIKIPERIGRVEGVGATEWFVGPFSVPILRSVRKILPDTRWILHCCAMESMARTHQYGGGFAARLLRSMLTGSCSLKE